MHAEFDEARALPGASASASASASWLCSYVIYICSSGWVQTMTMVLCLVGNRGEGRRRDRLDTGGKKIKNKKKNRPWQGNPCGCLLSFTRLDVPYYYYLLDGVSITLTKVKHSTTDNISKWGSLLPRANIKYQLVWPFMTDWTDWLLPLDMTKSRCRIRYINDWESWHRHRGWWWWWVVVVVAKKKKKKKKKAM